MMVLIMVKKASVVQTVSILEKFDLLVMASHQAPLAMLKMHCEIRTSLVLLALSKALAILSVVQLVLV
jgi:hypothetical protein